MAEKLLATGDRELVEVSLHPNTLPLTWKLSSLPMFFLLEAMLRRFRLLPQIESGA
jgi:hypothetical protein